jgi:hypothetical protein
MLYFFKQLAQLRQMRARFGGNLRAPDLCIFDLVRVE